MGNHLLRAASLLAAFAGGVVVGWLALGSAPQRADDLQAPHRGASPSGTFADLARGGLESHVENAGPPPLLQGGGLVPPGSTPGLRAELRSQAAEYESPPSVGQAALDEGMRYLERRLSEARADAEADAAHSILGYEWIRSILGEIEDPARLLLQARGTVGVELLNTSGETRSATPLDVTSMWEAGMPNEVYAVGGVIPCGQVLVVEQVQLRARCGSTDGTAGSVQFTVGGGVSSHGATGAWGAFAVTLQGRVVLRPFEGDLRLEVHDAVAEARIMARLVPERDAPESTGLQIAAREAGFLQPGAVTLQISNPQSWPVYLGLGGSAGGSSFSPHWSPDPVWPAADPVRPMVYADGAGQSSGEGLSVTRVDWRAIALGAEEPSLEVRVRDVTVLRVTPEPGRASTGSWDAATLPRLTWLPQPTHFHIVCRGCVAEAVFEVR